MRKAPNRVTSRGYLPHVDVAGHVQHVIFRTEDALPVEAVDHHYTDEHARYAAIEDILDAGLGKQPLADPQAADIVADALCSGDSYALHAWCVMPNHVHALIAVRDDRSLGDIVRAWKGPTARRIQALRGTSGRFWAREWFDRFMRDEDQLGATIAYIERNPVAAGLCAAPADWRWSSACKEKGAG